LRAAVRPTASVFSSASARRGGIELERLAALAPTGPRPPASWRRSVDRPIQRGERCGKKGADSGAEDSPEVPK